MTPFRDLAVLFEKLERTSSSSAMTSMLARFLPTLSPEEVRMTAYFLAGRIGPSFSAPEIGIGQVSAARAVAESSGQGIENVRKLIRRDRRRGYSSRNSDYPTKLRIDDWAGVSRA